jgi:Mrp family chromosome partitioning ATPase
VAETLAHLGLLLARHGQGDVLLVDANLTAKTLSGCFEAEERSGVSDVLDHGGAWGEHVVALETDGVHLLPAGLQVLSSADAGVEALPGLLGQWKDAYRFLLVDGGDARGWIACTLGRLCGAAYFLVQLGSTDAEEAVAAVAQLQAFGVPLRGCVVVNVPD